MLREIKFDQNGITDIYKPDKSIELLREFEPMAINLHPDGYYLCYSGGKDSDTLLDITIKSGVKFTAHYNITGIDPPECVKHIKYTRSRLAEMGISLVLNPPDIFTSGPYARLRKNMWRLIVHKTVPPTRLCRYCCDHLKERGGKGRLCLTGVRRSESVARKGRRPLEIVTAKKKDKKLFNDNDSGRMQFENCMQKGKRLINPILHYQTSDIWEYLRKEKVPYCNLYDDGVDRIGCVGCPNGGSKGMEEDFKRYPHYKKMYIKAYDEMLKYRISRGLTNTLTWKTGEDVLEWQMYGTDKEQQELIEGQMSIWDEVDPD